jgi:DNA repair exonuclease SbcCD ATPase subunit
VFERFRRKKEDAKRKGGEVPKDDVNPKFRSEENRDPPKYTFRRPGEEEKSFTELLAGLLQRLKTLDKQRTDLEEDIRQLSEEAEEEAGNIEKELSALREQTKELQGVLTAIHAHKKGVHRLEQRR